ncbi:MAG: response regulator transcription factor [Ferruginibacter sp.]|nr:response regulator transcription factor [Cytophagales bacterium]
MQAEAPAITCLVVDDDPLDRLVIENELAKYPFLRLKGSFSHPLEARPLITRASVQLLFLDVDMPLVSGLELLKSLPEPIPCIFVTSHPEFALEGFEMHALDYLLKPLRADRFRQAVLRAKEFLEIQTKAHLYELHFENDFLGFKEGGTYNRVRMSEVLYLEALKDYTKVITRGKKYVTLANLRNFSEKLPPEKFLRIHRSFVVAVDKIRQVEQHELLLGDTWLPIGKTFRQEVVRFLAS